MGFLDATDRLFGGFLPGGPTPEEVRFRETALSGVTGALTTVAFTPFILGGSGLRAVLGDDDIRLGRQFENAFAIGRTGARRGNRNFSLGDAARSSLDLVTPDAIYQFDDQAARDNPGTQPGDFFPGGIRNPLTRPITGLVAAAVLVVLALAGGRR